MFKDKKSLAKGAAVKTKAKGKTPAKVSKSVHDKVKGKALH